jgi:hypothetical protein
MSFFRVCINIDKINVVPIIGASGGVISLCGKAARRGCVAETSLGYFNS